ncbi:MAG TPA: hypothetical protein VK897_23885 [Anaerolineales bacterium]|nr:hypothetical protein [Anaerolineales bacterium]
MPKKPEDVFVRSKQRQQVNDLLAESEKAIREGNKEQAYRLAVQATQVDSESIDAWLLRATLAPSLNERIICINRLNELAPGYQDRYNVAFFALKELLDRNPFLAYLEETDELYRVLNADRVVLTIPKKRALVNPSPPEQPQPGPLRAAYRWLLMSIIGLLSAGIATVIFAPLAAFAAIRAHHSLNSHAERVRSAVVLILAFVLFIIGVLFSILFILHWLG